MEVRLMVCEVVQNNAGGEDIKHVRSDRVKMPQPPAKGDPVLLYTSQIAFVHSILWTPFLGYDAEVTVVLQRGETLLREGGGQ